MATSKDLLHLLALANLQPCHNMCMQRCFVVVGVTCDGDDEPMMTVLFAWPV
jgi:hypothetical protein